MANEKKFEVAGGVSIVSTGKKTVQVKQEYEKVLDNVNAGAGQTIQNLMDQFCKLVYLIDASGSMGEGMLSQDSVKEYEWPAETLAKFRAYLAEHPEYLPIQEQDDIEDEEAYDDMGGVDVEDEVPVDIATVTDEALKYIVVSQGLSHKANIHVERNYKHRSKGRSKMMAVKAAAKKFVAERYRKFPQSRVYLYSFETEPRLLSSGATEQGVLNGIDGLPDAGGGGTNIYRAVHTAVVEFKKNPSEMGSHHLVLVSDGLDGSANQCKELVPRMKEHNIVFDFIFILGATGMERADSYTIETLKGICEATGGEFTVVQTEEDFVEKFLTVSNRPMLPPCN